MKKIIYHSSCSFQMRRLEAPVGIELRIVKDKVERAVAQEYRPMDKDKIRILCLWDARRVSRSLCRTGEYKSLV